MNALSPVPSLGVGLTYHPKLNEFIDAHSDLLDYLEVVPDTLWTNRGQGESPRYQDDPEIIARLKSVKSTMPVVPHSTGLHIGSAQRFRHEHIAQMRRWHEWLDFPWHSDHLAFEPASYGGAEAGVPVGTQRRRERQALSHLVPRARKVGATVPVPFALENNVCSFDLQREEFDDAEFLNQLCAEAGCYLVLDLHDLYTNCRKHRKDPMDTLARLDLERVIEIHVTGGMRHEGYYLNSHSGPAPGPVLDLLRYALLSCPNVGGVTFEIRGSWYELMGADALGDILCQLRGMWQRYQPLPSRKVS